jgi:hypothetical protein
MRQYVPRPLLMSFPKTSLRGVLPNSTHLAPDYGGLEAKILTLLACETIFDTHDLWRTIGCAAGTFGRLDRFGPRRQPQ